MNAARRVLALILIGGIAYALKPLVLPDQAENAVISAGAAVDPQRAFDAAAAAEKRWQEFRAGRAAEPPDPREIDRLDRDLGEIPLDWPRAEEAVALMQRLRAERPAIDKAYSAVLKAQRERTKAEVEKRLLGQRRDYARNAESSFLNDGQDAYISVEGEDLRTLRIRYVLVGRPFVFRFENDQKLRERLRDMGFT
ncbi:MAG TPA: hypothetical protein VNZ94_01880 [Xanthobacteraceae bacterium]|nr:hypothetical protein [Xanthobacteraceae bacterium]